MGNTWRFLDDSHGHAHTLLSLQLPLALLDWLISEMQHGVPLSLPKFGAWISDYYFMGRLSDFLQ